MSNHPADATLSRLPRWLKRPLPRSRGQKPVENLLGGLRLNTVCEEANCPNKAGCYAHGTATFMILGDTCTRRCAFCSVATGRPLPPDPDEPARVAEAAARMKLRHVVITSVDRDDLRDGGSTHWAAVVCAVREGLPGAVVEVLTPDFQGRREQIERVVEARPGVYNHNIETVPSLYRRIQPGSDYQRSLGLLRHVKQTAPEIPVKSGLMVGLGETREELSRVMQDLRGAGVDLLTVGQYLKPAAGCVEVSRYVPPEEFEEIRREAQGLGFSAVAAGPFVRSSYHAEELLQENPGA